MSASFAGKIIVITGAGSGIGRAIALSAAAEGARLALSDIDAANLAAVAEEARGKGAADCAEQVLDVTSEAAINDYAAAVQAALGSADIVFNNAGITRLGRFEKTESDAFKSVMDVNFWGPVNISRAFLPQLKARQGILVNISSVFGLVGIPKQSAYCSSKFALRGFSESLRQELLGSGVQVVSVHPGGINTSIAKNAVFDEGADKREETVANMHKTGLVMPAEQAAAIIVKGVKKRKPRVLVGNDARLLSFVQRVLPAKYPSLLARLVPGSNRGLTGKAGVNYRPDGPSLRSRLLSAFLKQTFKKLIAKGDADINVLRARMDKRVKNNMPSNIDITAVDDNGVKGEWQIPAGVNTGRTIYYLHGGGYTFCNPATHRRMTAKLAQCSVAQLFSLDYRLAPENPYPAAVEDALAGYRWLLDQGIAPERMVIAGDSAGGGLTTALLLKLKEVGLPQPSGAILLSPWTDLSATGASLKSNAATCAMFTEAGILKGASYYVGDQEATNPFISPLFGDLTGVAPILAYASDTELLLDDTLRLAERAAAAGVEMETHIWKNQPHVWPVAYPQIPEAAEALAQMGDFVNRQTNVRKRQAQSDAA